jgi:hypothetical protein
VTVRNQGKVERASLELRHEFVGRGADDLDLDVRIDLRESLEDVGQEAQGIVVGRAEADGSGDGRRMKCPPDRVVQRQHVARVLQQELAMPCQLYGAAAAAMQQLLAEQGFQPLHLHGHSRLRPPDEVSRAGETALLGDEDKGAQQIGVKR